MAQIGPSCGREEHAVSGKEIEFSTDGSKTRAYPSVPGSGRGPGVIVIHEWWGMSDQIQGVADRLARAGFVALEESSPVGTASATYGRSTWKAHSRPAETRTRQW